MQVHVGNVLRCVEPNSDFILYYDKKLKLKNPEYSNRLRMGYYVGNIPKHIYLYKMDGDDMILPYGELLSIGKVCQELGIKLELIKEMPFYRATPKPYEIELFEYQRKAVNSIYGKPCGILQAPAASGKTQMGIATAIAIGHKTLWLTHTLDLLNQSYERACRYIPKEELGIISGGKVRLGKFITFATVQTMANLDLSELKNTFQVVIVDECHRVCGSPTQVTQFSKVLNNLSAPHKYGLSATVHRSDGLIQCAYSLLGDVIHEVPQAEVEDRIMPVGITRVDTGSKASMFCYRSDGTFDYMKWLQHVVTDNERNKLIAEMIKGFNGKPCLVLSDRIAHLEEIQKLIPDEKVALVHGKQTTVKGKAERQQAIEDMRNGNKTVLLATYSLAKEGLDIPCLENLILATPHKDYAVITQSIGRIARVCPGKDKATCYDLVDDIRYCMTAWKKRVTVYKKNRVYFN